MKLHEVFTAILGLAGFCAIFQETGVALVVFLAGLFVLFSFVNKSA